MPDIKLTTITKLAMDNSNQGLLTGIDMDLPVILFIKGKNICKSIKAINTASNVISKDSPKNWMTNCLRNAPIAFLTPTSRARSIARAVARLMKLNIAINNTISPTAENICM